MTSTFRYIAFGAALSAGALVCTPGFADSTSSTPASSASTKTTTAAAPKASTTTTQTPAPNTTATNPANQQPPADQQAPNGGVPLSTDQMSKEYQALSPETRDALLKTLKAKGIDGLSNMSESDARTTFNNLPDNVKQQIQAKWDGLSDEQRIALKKMGPDAVKQMFASQMKDVMQQTIVAPVLKPVQTVVATTQAAVQKTQTVLQQARATVQTWLAKVRGQSTQTPDQTTTATTQ